MGIIDLIYNETFVYYIPVKLSFSFDPQHRISIKINVFEVNNHLFYYVQL